MAKTIITLAANVREVDQYGNVTLETGQHIRKSSFSRQIDLAQPGDFVTVEASYGKDGRTLWIDTLRNSTANRGSAVTTTTSLNGIPVEPSPEAEQARYLRSQRVLKAFEIAFNYMKDDSDADQSDAINLAKSLIKEMEDAGA